MTRFFLFLLVWIAASAFLGPGAVSTAPDREEYPWIYLRDGQSLSAGEPGVELIAVGDLSLARGVIARNAPLQEVSAWLRTADLVFGNLECAISENAQAETGPDSGPGGPFLLVAPPGAAGILAAAGFDILSLANNHSLDGGQAGLGETAWRLQEAGIEPVGAGAGSREAYQPLVRSVKGVRLAFLAFNAIPSPGQPSVGNSSPGWRVAGWDPDRAAAAIRAARRQADAVVVSLHWGYEYQSRPDPAQREIARALQAAGADLVIGHHPHVVQPVHLDLQPDARAHLVAYSLGNFLFDQEFGQTRQGLALRAVFDRQGLRAVQALPLLAGPRPQWMDPEGAAGWWQGFQPLRKPIGFRCSRERCLRAKPVDITTSGIFAVGQVDLTGDGQPEEVRLEGDRLVISQAERTAWESPPEWRVIDAAIGDPDQDGRTELVLALRKPDSQGILRSHPFVFGYRGGLYRTLWGGSAVGDPILEVELGDLDGDGEQELIVLDEQKSGQRRTISIWRWHGWGFSLDWHSPPGDYEDLLFVPPQEGAPASLRVFNIP